MSSFEETESEIPDPNEVDLEDRDIDADLELRNAFSSVLAQHGFQDTLVLTRERADAIFHERRLEILDYLTDHEPTSVRALSEELDLDKGVVSRDLQILARLDVVEFDEEGREKASRLKHRHVAVEPVV